MEKQKLNEQLSRIREIMSITLKESNSSLKKNIELDIKERVAGTNINNIISNVKDFKKLPSIYKSMFNDLEQAIGLYKDPIKLGNQSLSTGEEIFNAIKNGSLVDKTQLGRVEKGFLKSTNTPTALRKSIIVDFVIDKNVLKDLSKVPGGKTTDIKKYLKGKGYADDSINEIITQLRSNGKIDKAGNFVGSVTPNPVNPNNPNPVNPNNPNPVNPNNPNPKPNPKWWDSLKTIGWKKALLTAGAVGGSLLLWYWFKQNNIKDKDIPVDPPVDPNNEWAPCLKKLKESGQAKVVRTSSNTLVLRVINTTYPDGVLFFTDGRVLTNDGKKKGTWKCKEGKTVVKEQSTGNNLSIDVQSVIKSLEGQNITVDGLNNVNFILDKYIEKGQGKQFLDLYKKTSGDFLEKTLISKTSISQRNNPEKNKIRDTIYGKIRTIKGSGGTSTDDPLSGIEIIWDDGKKEGGDKIPVKKDNYVDCPSFPLRGGCKGPLVTELQTCLKMTGVDGKLGPKTKATAETWAKSKGISLTIPTGGSGGNVDGQVVFGVTEENFIKICGGEPVPVRVEPDPEPVTNVDGPVVNPTTNPETPTNSDVGKKSDEQLGFEIYNRIKDDFRNKDYFGRTRLVYRGPDLSDEEQNLLTKYLNLKGYALTDDIEKKEGEKLVYKRIREKN